MNRRTTVLAASLSLAVCLLAGCGGGGGGDPVVDGGGGGGGGGQPGGTGLNPGLTGVAWLRTADTPSYYRINANTGEGPRVADRADLNQSLTFSPDGSRYAATRYEASTSMSVDIVDVASKNVLSSFQLEGYAEGFRFSPDNRYLGMIQSPDLAASNTPTRSGLLIVDLGTPTDPKISVDFINSGNEVLYSFDWVSGDRYLYLRKDRQLITGTAGASGNDDRVQGTLAVPAENGLRRGLDVSPDGTQLLVGLGWADGALTKGDVWVASADGSRLERFSRGEFGMDAHWSPDGKYIMLSTNAGAFSQAGGSTAYCRRWYAAATARNVTEDSEGSRLIRYIKGGTAEMLPCFSSVAWGS